MPFCELDQLSFSLAKNILMQKFLWRYSRILVLLFSIDYHYCHPIHLPHQIYNQTSLPYPSTSNPNDNTVSHTTLTNGTIVSHNNVSRNTLPNGTIVSDNTMTHGHIVSHSITRRSKSRRDTLYRFVPIWH